MAIALRTPSSPTNLPACDSGSCATAEQSRPASFAAAVREWTAALAVDAVDVADPSLDRSARTTGSKSYRPLAILWPVSTGQVQQILQIASKHGIGIHPIPAGRTGATAMPARLAPIKC